MMFFFCFSDASDGSAPGEQRLQPASNKAGDSSYEAGPETHRRKRLRSEHGTDGGEHVLLIILMYLCRRRRYALCEENVAWTLPMTFSFAWLCRDEAITHGSMSKPERGVLNARADEKPYPSNTQPNPVSWRISRQTYLRICYRWWSLINQKAVIPMSIVEAKKRLDPCSVEAIGTHPARNETLCNRTLGFKVSKYTHGKS